MDIIIAKYNAVGNISEIKPRRKSWGPQKLFSILARRYGEAERNENVTVVR